MLLIHRITSGCLSTAYLEAERFVPFFEPEYPELPENERYIAGFKDEYGERWGVVPLPRSIVDREVLLENFLQPQINIDGAVRV